MSVEEEKNCVFIDKKRAKNLWSCRKKKYDFLNTCGFVFLWSKKNVWRKKETRNGQTDWKILHLSFLRCAIRIWQHWRPGAKDMSPIRKLSEFSSLMLALPIIWWQKIIELLPMIQIFLSLFLHNSQINYKGREE